MNAQERTRKRGEGEAQMERRVGKARSLVVRAKAGDDLASEHVAMMKAKVDRYADALAVLTIHGVAAELLQSVEQHGVKATALCMRLGKAVGATARVAATCYRPLPPPRVTAMRSRHVL